jgi:transposase
MANVLKDEKKQQIIALGRLGWSLRKIQEATRVRRGTISAYLRGAGVEIWPPGRWKRERKAKPAIGVITGSEAAKPALPGFADPLNCNPNCNPNPENPPEKGKATTTSKPAIAVITDFGVGLSDPSSENSPAVGSASACEPYREIIELGLGRDRNARAIWRDLVSDHAFQGGYQSVRRFAYKLRGAQVPQARAVILTEPGEEGQVDYGNGPMVREPHSSKYRRTRLFVLTLGYSRKAVRLLVFRSSTRIWAELHEKAFRRLGGAPRILVLDNLREGVLVPDFYDPTVNPLYRDVLALYGAVALPCRIQDPDRKGKVESAVGHAKRTPLQGQRFENLGTLVNTPRSL